MIKNVIFDWSGTLVDDLPAVWRATNYVFRRAGLEEWPLERFRAEFFLPFKLFYDRHTPHVGMPQLEEWFHQHFRTVQESVREMPFARAFLEVCRERGIRTFLLSTIHRDHFAAQCGVTGFDAYLEKPYIEALDKRLKIGELLRENGLAPEETLFIGDMEHDIETAKCGGVYSCAVLTGFSDAGVLRASSPDLLVEHLGELRVLLDRRGWTLCQNEGKGAKEDAPVATVGGLIFNREGKALMIRTQKWSNLWGIPGGKIKRGESARDALCREVLEETNLTVENVDFVMVQDCVDSPEFYRSAHFLLLNYTCACAASEEVRLNEEAQEFRWTTMREAYELPLNAPTRRLLDAVRARGDAKSRSETANEDIIGISDLEVFYRVGVPEEERERPQRLLLDIELTHAFGEAAATDDLRKTIDYGELSRRLIQFGEGKSWRLIETLASGIADVILEEYRPESVRVRVKKFIIPEARHVSVETRKRRK